MQFFETSARSGEGIKDAFESIAREIIKDLDRRGVTTTKPTRDAVAQARNKNAGDSRPSRFDPDDPQAGAQSFNLT